MPTTKEIYNNIIAQIEAETGQSVPLPRRAFTRVIAAAFAAIYTTLFKYAQFIFLQYFPRTASTVATTVLGNTIIPLEELGVKNGTGYRKSLQTAIYDIVTEVTADGATISAGATLTSSIQALSFEVISDTVIAGVEFNWPPDNPTATDWQIVRVRATTEGAAGALLLGETLEWDVQPTGTTGDAQQYATITEGTDAETWEEYRTRVISRDANVPQGGATYDYYLWATSVSGVTDAYPVTGEPGTVVVYIDGPSITPAIIAAVENAINLNDAGLATRRPISSTVIVEGIISQSVDILISGLVADDEVTAKANVATAAAAYLSGLKPYIEGVSQPPINNTFRVSDLQYTIYSTIAADGASISSVSAPSVGSSALINPGFKLELGTITWL